MVSERMRKFKEKPEDYYLTDGAIMDAFNNVLCGSTGYHDKIVAMYDGTGKNFTLYFKQSDMPDELLDPFWYYGEEERILKCLDKKVQEVFEYVHKKGDWLTDDIDYDKIKARLIIDDEKLISNFEDVNTDTINRFMVVDGLITSKTDVQKTILKSRYKCDDCKALFDLQFKKCPTCEEIGLINLSLEDSVLIGAEYITLQEFESKTQESFVTLPKQLKIHVKGDMVNKFNVGQTVRVSGFVRAKPNSSTYEVLRRKKIPGMIDLATFDLFLESYNIEYKDMPHELIIKNPDSYITEKDKARILALRKRYSDNELLDVLINSFAYKLYGLSNLKEAILLQAVGPNFIDSKERDWINILIVGDPGIGKSALLSHASEINIHSARAVGKGASGVGLTASVIKEKDSLPQISIGPAVLANKGVCIIDEFSNISDEHKEHLRECMESGSFTLTKYGINRKITTRAAYLVASNPDSGRYSPENSLTENIKISPPLLSRFDLIFVIVDKVDEAFDQRVRIHLMARRNKKPVPKDIDDNLDRIDEEFLKKYLVYAKIQKTLVIKTNEAQKRFDAFHRDLRKPKKSSDIPAGHRQFDGITRIAEALARLLLKTEVDENIADLTIKLLNSAYESTGMRIGNSVGLNQTMIYSKPLDKINPKKAFIMVMKHLTNDNTVAIEKEAVVLELRDKALMPIEDVYTLWDKMDRAGALMVENGRFYKLNYDNLLS